MPRVTKTTEKKKRKTATVRKFTKSEYCSKHWSSHLTMTKTGGEIIDEQHLNKVSGCLNHFQQKTVHFDTFEA